MQLRELVMDDVSIQYKLALASAGMVDSPLHTASTATRLHQLHAYVDAWKNNDLTGDILHAPPHPGYLDGLGATWWPSTGGVLPRVESECFILFRPASASRGIPEKTWRMTELRIDPLYIRTVGVDFSQDLLVVVCVGADFQYVQRLPRTESCIYVAAASLTEIGTSTLGHANVICCPYPVSDGLIQTLRAII